MFKANPTKNSSNVFIFSEINLNASMTDLSINLKSPVSFGMLISDNRFNNR